jgi:hypothetical protein
LSEIIAIILPPMKMLKIKRTRKRKKRIFAISIDAPAIDVNPSSPATIATTRNMRLHLSIGIDLMNIYTLYSRKEDGQYREQEGEAVYWR